MKKPFAGGAGTYEGKPDRDELNPYLFRCSHSCTQFNPYQTKNAVIKWRLSAKSTNEMATSKDVQYKLVPGMIPACLGIVVLPLAIVNRDPHFLGISVVQVIGAAVVLAVPVVLWIVYIRIVVEPLGQRVLPQRR